MADVRQSQCGAEAAVARIRSLNGMLSAVGREPDRFCVETADHISEFVAQEWASIAENREEDDAEWPPMPSIADSEVPLASLLLSVRSGLGKIMRRHSMREGVYYDDMQSRPKLSELPSGEEMDAWAAQFTEIYGVSRQADLNGVALKPRRKKIIDLIMSFGQRMTTEAVIAGLTENGFSPSTGVTKEDLSTLVEFNLLNNRKDGHGKGYGLPDWT